MTETVLTGLALLALRIGVGVELVVHGWPKIKSRDTIAGFTGQLGMKPAMFWAWVAALVEFFGGLALLIGLLTRPAAFFVTIEFLIIAFYLKPRKMKVPFTTPQGQAGWEWDWLIMWMGLALLLAGSGAYGLDRVLSLPF